MVGKDQQSQRYITPLLVNGQAGAAPGDRQKQINIMPTCGEFELSGTRAPLRAHGKKQVSSPA